MTQVFSDALEGRYLLDHPFYRRWEAGTLEEGELARYASQYRHIEGCLPEVLKTVSAGLAPGVSRQLVEDNLSDELSRPAPHTALFEDFAAAVGAPEEPPTEATQDLLDVYREAARDPGQGLAVLGAYEVQGAAIAASKASGLRRHYGLDATATSFWDVHAAMERDHASWTLDALHDADPAQVGRAARTSADAWWAFLDDREAESRPALAVG